MKSAVTWSLMYMLAGNTSLLLDYQEPIKSLDLLMIRDGIELVFWVWRIILMNGLISIYSLQSRPRCCPEYMVPRGQYTEPLGTSTDDISPGIYHHWLTNKSLDLLMTLLSQEACSISMYSLWSLYGFKKGIPSVGIWNVFGWHSFCDVRDSIFVKYHLLFHGVLKFHLNVIVSFFFLSSPCFDIIQHTNKKPERFTWTNIVITIASHLLPVMLREFLYGVHPS